MTRPLVILGTGGSAYDVLDIVDALNRAAPAWQVVGFLDDSRPVGSTHLGLPVLGGIAGAVKLPADHMFINVIGSDRSFRDRPAIVASTQLPPERFATLVHPLASVSLHARLGRGVYVAFDASVAGGVRVGDFAALCPGVIVGHDSLVDEFALLAPGAVVSGCCRIGRASYIGAKAAIRQRVVIGEEALVGMAAVVLQDVAPKLIVAGVPARALASSLVDQCALGASRLSPATLGVAE